MPKDLWTANPTYSPQSPRGGYEPYGPFVWRQYHLTDKTVDK